MFFNRKPTPPPPRKASVVLNKPQIHQAPVIHQPSAPKEQSYYDMMEEVLLQTIRSSSMALLDLYKRRGQAPMLPPMTEMKMLPPPEPVRDVTPRTTPQATRTVPPQATRTVAPQPVRTAPPKTVAPQTPKKLHLEQVNINTISKKIISEIDDLVDISKFNEKILKEVLKQSLTWNTVTPKVDNESLSSLFKSLIHISLRILKRKNL